MKIVGFLKADKIRLINIKKRRKTYLSILPVVGAVIGQPETQIEGQNRKHGMFELMRIRFDQLEIVRHIKADIVKVAECDIIKRQI